MGRKHFREHLHEKIWVKNSLKAERHYEPRGNSCNSQHIVKAPVWGWQHSSKSFTEKNRKEKKNLLFKKK